MKQDLGLVVGLLVISGFLAFEAFFAYLGWSAIQMVSGLEVSGTLQAQVERIRGLQPLVYALAFEGFVLGPCAILFAVAVWRRKPWARGAVLVGSAVLVLVSGLVVLLSPPLWHRQGNLVLGCAWCWWALYEGRSRHVPSQETPYK
jgi:hypothetical protein